MIWSFPQIVAASTLFAGGRPNELTVQCPQIPSARVNTISVTGKVSVKTTLCGVRCYATQTQNVHRKSSIATIKQADPKGKLNGPKLDDGSGGFPVSSIPLW